MEFQLDFNRENGDALLQEFGATLHIKNGEDYGYFIELKDFKEMEELEETIYDITGIRYSLIVGFDPATIYLDKDV